MVDLNIIKGKYIDMRTGKSIDGAIDTDEKAISAVSKYPGDAAENLYKLLREKAGYSISEAMIYVLETRLGNLQPNPFDREV